MRILIAVLLLVAGCSTDDVRFDPSKEVKFRYYARDLLSALDSPCPITEREARLAEYGPVRQRFAALKAKIAGSRLAIDLAIVEADEAFIRSATIFECADLDPPKADHYISIQIKNIERNLSIMERIADKGRTS